MRTLLLKEISEGRGSLMNDPDASERNRRRLQVSPREFLWISRQRVACASGVATAVGCRLLCGFPQGHFRFETPDNRHRAVWGSQSRSWPRKVRARHVRNRMCDGWFLCVGVDRPRYLVKYYSGYFYKGVF